MRKIARSVRQHRGAILDYFGPHKLISSGVVEAFGFRTYRVLELALLSLTWQGACRKFTHSVY